MDALYLNDGKLAFYYGSQVVEMNLEAENPMLEENKNIVASLFVSTVNNENEGTTLYLDANMMKQLISWMQKRLDEQETK